MIVKKRGLGRGLDALMGGSSRTRSNAEESQDQTADLPPAAELPQAAEIPPAAEISQAAQVKEPKDSELRELPIDLLQPGKYQPRTDMHNESLEDLANSIRAQGILQPIVVRKLAGSDRFEIIAGERRWRAAQLAELHEVPAVVRDVSDNAAIAMALIENIQREDLNPVEEATALQRLINEFEMTHQQAADAVGRSRAAVSNLLRLLSLAADVRVLLEKGELEMGHARAILSLESSVQSSVAREIATKRLSVREAEQLVRKLRSDKGDTKPKKKEIDPNIQQLQDGISEKLGAKVQFHHLPNGKGKVVVHYNSLDELDGILAHIK
ncbi:MAG: ParB/RepB/Spo0J family partition protein [Gammaproteobacteria bacterium]|nr:ParB/RepB/Spo0J family partition protein [Gammaproteobacteria bacterium]MDH5800234.1 ParB/RepB/Spo0J family partition protein [Gammaproteobacteria bacterium]